MSQPSLFSQLKLSFAEFWSVREARERNMLIIALLVILLSLVYAVLIAPAINGREILHKKLPALREQVTQMQSLSKLAASYGEQMPPTVGAISKESLEIALARNGLKPQSVTVAGDFIQLQLTDVSFTNTLNWLEEMQKSARVSVSEASIIALSQPDKVDVKLTLQQHRADQ